LCPGYRRIKENTKDYEQNIRYNQDKKQFLDELPHFKKEISSENKTKLFFSNSKFNFKI